MNDESHRTYDELDDAQTMACDCLCACANLDLTPGDEAHVEHVASCDGGSLCDLHIDDKTARVGEDIHLHFH